jgi:hypothetical protein
MTDRIFYHGAKRPFNRFSYSHVDTGSKAAQEGVGFYLTSSKQDAAAYGNFVLTVSLPQKLNLVPLTGKPNITVMTKIIKKAPDVKNELLNWGDTPQQGLAVFLKGIAHETPHEAYQSVWYAFYHYSPAQYVKNMAEAGFDGILINRREGVKHFIGFNPFKLKVINIEKK